jgi:hypothetical protein
MPIEAITQEQRNISMIPNIILPSPFSASSNSSVSTDSSKLSESFLLKVIPTIHAKHMNIETYSNLMIGSPFIKNPKIVAQNGAILKRTVASDKGKNVRPHVNMTKLINPTTDLDITRHLKPDISFTGFLPVMHRYGTVIKNVTKQRKIAKSPTVTPSSFASLKNVPIAMALIENILTAISAMHVESLRYMKLPILADFSLNGRASEL